MAKRRGSNEGSIYQERSGRWRAAVNLGWRNGKRLRKTFTAKTRQEVQQKLAEALRLHQTGYNVAPEKRSVGQFLTEWIELHVKSSVKPKTLAFYECVVNKWITPRIGEVPLRNLTPNRVKQLLVDLADSGLAPKSVKHAHRTLCTALGLAERHGAIQRNVASLVDPPHVPKPAITFLTVEQARTFLGEAHHDRLGAMFTTILSLGLRLGEARALRWGDVDIDGGRVTIRHTLQRVDGEYLFSEPKSAASRRTVRLPAVAIQALRHHQARQEQERAFAGDKWQDWELLFTTMIGRPVHETVALKQFQRMLARVGLPKLRIHDLRHSAVALLIAQGLNVKAISELLGHSSVAFTLQVYGHLMDEAKQATADAMDAVLGSVATSLATSENTEPVN